MNFLHNTYTSLSNEDIKLLLYLQEFGLYRYSKIRRLFKTIELNPSADQARAYLYRLVENAQKLNTKYPNALRASDPVSQVELQGNIFLGVIPTSGVSWFVPPAQFTRNVLITGPSGGGKTNFNLLLISELLQHSDSTVKIFDRKLDYACLNVFPTFSYIVLEDFEDNWIEPPFGMHHPRWIPTLSQVLSNQIDIRIAGRNLFTSVALWLCKERQSDTSGNYPTIKDIYNVIRYRKYPAPSHLARYQETLVNRLEGILSVYGSSVCSQRRKNWQAFVNSSWAISLDGIPTDYQNLFISVMTAKMLMYRMANNLRGQ